MEHNVKLYIKGGGVIQAKAKQGDNLLHLIQKYDSDFIAPCGGHGSCGKCRVEIKEHGHVTSCLYSITKDIEVVLPRVLEMKVLSTQYEHSKQLWLNPGPSANLSPLPYGLAVDIGTTTIVFYIVNLVFGTVTDTISMPNPQGKYGSDVISRIFASTQQKDGHKKLQKELIDVINKVVEDYCTENDLSIDFFVKVSLTGNTTMLHNIMGEEVLSLAQAPFTPVFLDSKKIQAKEVGINIHNSGELVMAPGVNAYIGSDIIAGLASLDTSKLKNKYLFIDIGTNSEMVLVADDKVFCCAAAAGPAFEGTNISCGMSSSDGAISKYNEDGYEVIGKIKPVGVCGSGLIDIVSLMLKKNLIQSDGNIDRNFVIYESDKEKVELTQQDIREVQLAKSAIHSGIKRLLAIAGVNVEELDHVLLAGGFGNYININNAIKIGLLPDVAPGKFIQIGNSSGTGAVLALKSENFTDEMNYLQEKMEYIELSTDEDFTLEFAMNMFF